MHVCTFDVSACTVSNCQADQCVITDGKAFCDACENGYRKGYSSGALNGKCTKCTTGCLTCSTNADGTEKCLSCSDGYKLANDACEGKECIFIVTFIHIYINMLY